MGPQLYSIVGHKENDVLAAVHVPDSKPVVDSNVHVLNVRRQSRVHTKSKQPTIDPRVLSVVHKQPAIIIIIIISSSSSVQQQRVLSIRTGHNFKPSSLIVTKQ